MRATGDTLVVVAFTKGPKADLIEVMQAEGSGEGVHERDVECGGRDYVGEVEFEEVGGAEYRFVGRVANYCLRFISRVQI